MTSTTAQRIESEANVTVAPDLAARLEDYVARAQTAAEEFRRLDQEAVDRIVEAMVVGASEAAFELAEQAMEETGFGVLEDKVVKNYIATEFLYDYLKDSARSEDREGSRAASSTWRSRSASSSPFCRSPTRHPPRCSRRSSARRRATR